MKPKTGEKRIGKKTVAVLLWLALWQLGAMTFGGGLTMLPLLEREIVEKRGFERGVIGASCIDQEASGRLLTPVDCPH